MLWIGSRGAVLGLAGWRVDPTVVVLKAEAFGKRLAWIRLPGWSSGHEETTEG